MPVTRRELLLAAGVFPALADAPAAQGFAGPLPDRSSFQLDDVYLDAAFTHPFGQAALDAASVYLQSRRADPQGVGPRHNSRSGAVERFARLINADRADIAVVPSTLIAENLVNASLGIGAGAGVVTDALHYDASLVLYGELKRRGTPVSVVRPRGERIDLADVRAMFTRDTRLVAVSLVSNSTGFEHDLAELCALAHSAGALVYADIVQAAGAVPIDVKSSGVDFAACGTYKWLMGDFGTAFLYVRPDRVDRLKRVEVGWRQLRAQESHVLPFESPGPAGGTYELAPGAAGIFEVSTPAWGALAIVAGSLDYLAALGIPAIVRHREPLMHRLRQTLPALGFEPLTPEGSQSPIMAFADKDAERRFAEPLRQAKIRIGVHEHRIRVSPSVYNTLDEIDHLVSVLSGH
jgi:selenocysteine lyase/cysteine desulfurase